MKTKFYFLITFVFLAFVVSAQRPNVMYVAGWMNNAWADTLKTTSTYDTNGNLIKLNTQVWNLATNQWVDAIMITYSLNSDNTIRESLTHVWVQQSNSFQDLVTTFTYSATKKKLTETISISIGPLSGDISKTTYTYNDKDSLVTQLDQMANPFTLQLTNSSQTSFTYNPDGTLDQHVTQSWLLNQWQNSMRNTNTYNASKRVISTLNETWVNNAWEKQSRSTFNYSANGSIMESLEENWINNVWVNFSMGMYTYTANNKIQQIVTQKWNALAQWENESRISYDYATGIVPVELAGVGALVYPNPFEDQITIESSSLNDHSIQVYNVVGQLIKSVKTNRSVTNLNLGGLEKGVYFMKINTADNEQTIKLLKAR